MCKLFIILFAFTVSAHAQKTLQITTERFGKIKIYELSVNDYLVYKEKGKSRYAVRKISNFADSLIVFDNDSLLHFRKLKKILLKKNNHFAETVQSFFIVGGVLFSSLNAVNNLLNDRKPVFNPVAGYVSAGLFGAGIIIHETQVKRIRINKRITLKVIEKNYRNLNEAK